MEKENHKEEVPFSHYEALFREMQPETARSRLPELPWDGAAYSLTLLGRQYRISWPEYAIAAADGGPAPNLPTQTFLLRYLLEGRRVPSQGEWKTFREMPWGELYIKPYTGRVLTRAAFTFGTRVEAFRQAAVRLHGLPVQHGDAGFEFAFLDDYRIRILVWEGDDEFPPNAQVLYSDNFAAGFAAEDRVVAGDILISAIKAAM